MQGLVVREHCCAASMYTFCFNCSIYKKNKCRKKAKNKTVVKTEDS